MDRIKVLFLGSFQEHSAHLLELLLDSQDVEVMGIVTTPPFIDKQSVTQKNPVQVLAEKRELAVATPSDLNEESLKDLETRFGRPDFLLTAGYGKLLPNTWLTWPTVAALNLHFSLLPKYRGANPAEWALLAGETETGVTLIEMSPSFDTGKLIANAVLPIGPQDTRETVYHKLYDLGGRALPAMLQTYAAFRSNTTEIIRSDVPLDFFLPPEEQPKSPTPYASRFTRNDGLVAWSALVQLQAGQVAPAESLSPLLQKALAATREPLTVEFIERASRALAGFPSLWTLIPTAKGEKRMKVISCQVDGQKLILDQVQVEGKSVSRWADSKNIVTE